MLALLPGGLRLILSVAVGGVGPSLQTGSAHAAAKPYDLAFGLASVLEEVFGVSRHHGELLDMIHQLRVLAEGLDQPELSSGGLCGMLLVGVFFHNAA